MVKGRVVALIGIGLVCALPACPWQASGSTRGRRRRRSRQSSGSTICCSAAATSSIRATSISAVRDVAIADGKIAAVAAKLDPADALKTVDASGLYVTPGLIDIHAHVYAGTGERGSYAGDNSVYPDGFTFRVGVTTVADAGCAGWRNFEDFKQRVIDRSKTRVLAFLNIVGNGMRGGKFEQDLADMEAKPTADMARKHPGLIVGIKTAHYSGPEWAPVERAVEAGTIANIPVMVDFGSEPARASDERAGDEEAPAGRHLHARLLRAARRAGSRRAA